MLTKVRSWKISWPAPSFFRTRLLFCGILAFAIGILLSLYVPYGHWMIIAFFAAAALALVLRRVKILVGMLALLSMVLFGLSRAALEWDVPEMPEDAKWTVSGIVDGPITQSEKAVSFFLSDVSVLSESEEWIPIHSNVYCYYPTESKVRLEHDQEVRVSGSRYWPSVPRNPGGFDQKTWLAQNGAHVRLYATSAPKILKQAEFSVRGLAFKIRGDLGARVDKLFGQTAPIIRAMLLGDQSRVPDEWSGWMRDSGIVHLLAVSGLHVALWYLLLDRLLKFLPVSPKTRWWLLAILLSVYSTVTGLADSVIRAAIMLLMIQGGYVVKRKVDPITSLSFAAFFILAVRPLDLFAPGFQLSFCAVLGLVLLRPSLKKVLPSRPSWLWDGLSTTAAAELGFLPAVATWFGNVSLIGLLLNLLAVPLAGLLIPVAAMGTALHALWAPLGWGLVMAAKGMAVVLLLAAKVGAAIPMAVLRVPAFAWWTAIAFFITLLLCSTAVIWRWRFRIACAALAACVAVGAGYIHGDFFARYVQLDVGQALSGVLHVGGKTFVYDCGNTNSDLTEYLIHSGADVEGLFLSHPHADHIDGLGELLDAKIPVRNIYVPTNAEAFGGEAEYRELLSRAWIAGATVTELAAGDILSLNGLTARIIAPERDATRGGDPNDQSIVMLVEIGPHTLLLCGDADGVAEPLGVDCDVLQVAHHGSSKSAQSDFLADATPNIALISTGRNSYGHPNPEALQRLEDAGAEIFITRDTGALTVYFAGEEIWVEAYCP